LLPIYPLDKILPLYGAFGVKHKLSA